MLDGSDVPRSFHLGSSESFRQVAHEFRYYRAPKGSYAREYFCDASDPERVSGICPGRIFGIALARVLVCCRELRKSEFLEEWGKCQNQN